MCNWVEQEMTYVKFQLSEYGQSVTGKNTFVTLGSQWASLFSKTLISLCKNTLHLVKQCTQVWSRIWQLLAVVKLFLEIYIIVKW